MTVLSVNTNSQSDAYDLLCEESFPLPDIKQILSSTLSVDSVQIVTSTLSLSSAKSLGVSVARNLRPSAAKDNLSVTCWPSVSAHATSLVHSLNDSDVVDLTIIFHDFTAHSADSDELSDLAGKLEFTNNFQPNVTHTLSV